MANNLMSVKALLAQNSHKPMYAFIGNNWGLAVSLKNRFRMTCGDYDLLHYCIEAFEKAESSYDELRTKKREGTKYTFLNHWGQCLKTIFTSEKKRGMKEVSLEEIIENKIKPGGRTGKSSKSFDHLSEAEELYTEDFSLQRDTPIDELMACKGSGDEELSTELSDSPLKNGSDGEDYPNELMGCPYDFSEIGRDRMVKLEIAARILQIVKDQKKAELIGELNRNGLNQYDISKKTKVPLEKVIRVTVLMRELHA